MSDRPDGRQRMRVGIARGYGYVEDAVYVGLGLLLAVIVVVMLIGSFVAFARAAAGGSVASSVSGLLDRILLILLIVELLYTVQVSFREHALLPEPFLLVGLISVIRRILVLTAAMGEQHQAGTPPPLAFVLELAVLGALIVALAISLVLLRRRDLSKAAPRS
jgi:uncharacterized membrane protein (DUF373 family)